jgi:hypothetical protein
LVQRVFRLLESESPVGYRWSARALAVLVPLLGLVLIATGAPPVSGGPWNMMIALDAGWRIVSGQVPHTDFHTSVGPLTYMLAAAGMKLGALSTGSFARGLVVLSLAMAPVAWNLASRRMPWALAFLFVIFVVVFMLTPRALGYDIRETTYGMSYNRIGYALLSIFLISLFLEQRESIKESDVLQGLLSGLTLALIFYCKVTYFLVAGVLTVAALALSRPRRTWLLSFAGGFLAVCAVSLALLHIQPLSYLRDIAAAGQSQSSGMRTKLLVGAVVSNTTWLYLLALCVGICAWSELHVEKPGRVLLDCGVAGLVLSGALLINVGNASQRGAADDPLYFVVALVFLERLRRREARRTVPAPNSRFARSAAFAVSIPIFYASIFVRDVASYGYATAWNVLRRPSFDSTRQIQSDRLRDFYVVESIEHTTAYWPSREHPMRINDGLALLRRNLQPGDRVTTMTICNPFSFALGLEPAHDGLLWWDLNFSFNRTHHPSAEEVFSETSVVMVPRHRERSWDWAFESVDAQLAIYGDYLSTHFREVESTETWSLYRRRN